MVHRSKSNWLQAVSAWRCRDMGSMPHSSPLHVLWSKKTWQVLKESMKVVCLQQVCVKPEVPKIHPVWCCAQATDANTYKMFRKRWTNLHLRHVVCFSLRKDSNWTVTRTKINELSNVGRLALGSLVRRVVGELQPELRLWPWPTEHPWVPALILSSHMEREMQFTLDVSITAGFPLTIPYLLLISWLLFTICTFGQKSTAAKRASGSGNLTLTVTLSDPRSKMTKMNPWNPWKHFCYLVFLHSDWHLMVLDTREHGRSGHEIFQNLALYDMNPVSRWHKDSQSNWFREALTCPRTQKGRGSAHILLALPLWDRPAAGSPCGHHFHGS